MNKIEFEYEVSLSKSQEGNQVVTLLLKGSEGERKIYGIKAVRYMTKKFAIMFTKEDKDYIKGLKEMTDKLYIERNK